MRRFVLRGDDAALAAALDRIHVAVDVAGVVERDGELELWVDGALPALDVAACELTLDDRTWTGFEADAPVLVADDLCVRPPWVAAPVGFTGDELVVPRGMAFGSGEHGSTQAALLALRDAWPQSGGVPAFADVGTGSGILALFAAQRGARRILACDVEPEAVHAARALLPAADVRIGGPEVFGPAAADLCVANLDARQLGEALDAIVALWSRALPLVLSGLRTAEADALAARVPARLRARHERLGFVALTFAGAA